MAEEMKTLLFTAVPAWIKDIPATSVHDGVARVLNEFKSTEFISCPDFENLRVQFFTFADAKYVKDIFDLVHFGITLQFSSFNLTSNHVVEEPVVSFAPIKRDTYKLDVPGSTDSTPPIVPYPSDSPFFNRHFSLQKELGRNTYVFERDYQA